MLQKKLSEEIKERVLKVVQESGFVPNNVLTAFIVDFIKQLGLVDKKRRKIRL